MVMVKDMKDTTKLLSSREDTAMVKNMVMAMDTVGALVGIMVPMVTGGEAHFTFQHASRIPKMCFNHHVENGHTEIRSLKLLYLNLHHFKEVNAFSSSSHGNACSS
ncbi:uncharacterized protein LOC119187658 isoform X2 [Rhipicephalus microplus]|uniref:uncharacterized protein LOC119187658 isoform X2 n=1 Tax=Rhipicephalus microplus TaxID=6941 RepID=UPI003F6B9B57